MFCKNCKYLDKSLSNGNKFACKNSKLTSDSYDNKEYNADDSLIYQFDEGGDFFVGENFGCIHFDENRA